jgi:hypothetical protein
MELLAPKLSLWVVVASIVILVLFLSALFRLLSDRSKTPNEKILWFLIIFLVPVLGSAVYLLTTLKKRQTEAR